MNKDLFKNRHQVIQIIIASFALIFLLRLFYVQVIDRKYVSLAKSNAIKEVDVYPTRGMVYDRKGELIVYNEAIYDLMIIPRQAKGIDPAPSRNSTVDRRRAHDQGNCRVAPS